MLQQDDLNFDSLTVPVHKLTDKQDPFDEFPNEFQKYEEFHLNSHLLRRKILKYIVFVYDPGSPLKGDIYKAKTIGADMAGFQRDEKGKFEGLIEQVFLGENDIVNKMIIRYLTNKKDTKYQKYAVLREAYYNVSKSFIEGSTDKIKNMKEIEVELEQTEIDLLNRDSNRNIKRELNRYYLEDKIELRPEDIVRKLRENPNTIPI